jgi:ataxin-10
MELLLASCTLDDASPLAREWALWGVRNMCQGNAAVQQHVSELQAVAHVHSPELARMGMQLELDSLTHKLKLVRRPGQEPQLLPADAPEEH